MAEYAKTVKTVQNAINLGEAVGNVLTGQTAQRKNTLGGVVNDISAVLKNSSGVLGVLGASGMNSVLDTSGVKGTSNELDTMYTDGGGRLSQFRNAASDTDAARVAYLQLIGNFAGGINSGTLPLEAQQAFKLLTQRGKYNKFVVSGISEHRSERVAVMPTVGDSYAATFSGREPMVISVQGALIFDYGYSNKQSWFTGFMYAYENYLRASKLAKYRCKIRFVIPDFAEYEGYMTALNASLDSNNDIVIPMNFTIQVTKDTISAQQTVAKGPEEGSLEGAVAKSKAAAANVKSNAQNKVTQSAGALAAQQKQDAFLQSLYNIANTAVSINKEFNAVSTRASTLNVLAGLVTNVGNVFGKRSDSYVGRMGRGSY